MIQSMPSSPGDGPTSVTARLPLSRPRWTFILLGINLLVFVAMTVFGAANGLGLNGTQDSRVLLLFGAMQNQLIAHGEYYRLFTSMFLHIGLIHLAFNMYALYVIGQDVEQLYGAARFLLIYLLGGLGGSLASYLLSSGGLSAGASGAIFALIGASIAYFYLHRNTFGARGQAQLRSMLMLAGINLLFGFTIPGINNLAHLGGLVFGALVGAILAPRYEAPSVFIPTGNALTLRDTTTLARRAPALLGVTALLIAMGVLGTLRWG